MLTEMQVKCAKAKDRDYKLADSEGLYLYVTAKGHRSWRMKYRFAGKERRLVLGAYPNLGLREARDRKADARKLLREGRDPEISANGRIGSDQWEWYQPRFQLEAGGSSRT